MMTVFIYWLFWNKVQKENITGSLVISTLNCPTLPVYPTLDKMDAIGRSGGGGGGERMAVTVF